MQLEKEMHTSSCNRGGSCTTIQRYSNYNEPRYNAHICKKNEEMSNIYSSNWFQLILDVVVN